jgi:hypothetical protein
MTPLHRLALLLVCLAAGAAVGAWGAAWSGSGAWWLAIPVALGIGWMAVADPTQCTPPPADDAGPPTSSKDPPPR